MEPTGINLKSPTQLIQFHPNTLMERPFFSSFLLRVVVFSLVFIGCGVVITVYCRAKPS